MSNNQKRQFKIIDVLVENDFDNKPSTNKYCNDDIELIREPEKVKKLKVMSNASKEFNLINPPCNTSNITQQHLSQSHPERISFQIDDVPMNEKFLNPQNRNPPKMRSIEDDSFMRFDEEVFENPKNKDSFQTKSEIIIEESGDIKKNKKYMTYEFNEPINPEQELLPVHEEMNYILETIEKHSVIVISGNTGCGKSTQIPKFIACKDTSTKIIVTQPRRVAAIALAQRVSEELKSELGQRVGYQIGQDSKLNRNTQILYVTIGIFLQKLVNEPDQFLREYTHIILDEVHERGIESDFGLIALKTFLSQSKNRNSIKLIVMSATLNKDIFLNYFSTTELDNLEKEILLDQDCKEYFFDSSKFEKQIAVNKDYDHTDWINQGNNNNVWNEQDNHDDIYQKMLSMICKYNCKYESGLRNFVEIKVVQKYQVQTVWLDQIDQAFKLCNKNYFNGRKPELNEDLYKLASNEIKRVLFHEVQMLNELKIKGDILVFLPGYNEIVKFRHCFESLIASLSQSHSAQIQRYPFKIMELHSSLGDINTRELLGYQKYTKIILATNIAESSITIPNCFVVIDFCLTKEINYNPSSGIERLELSWASKASITQRAGRTGRNCNGVNLRLVPKKFFEAEIRDYQTPEILRCPIEKVILKIKILDEGESEYKKVYIDDDEMEQNNLIEEVIQTKEAEKNRKNNLKFPNDNDELDYKKDYETKPIYDGVDTAFLISRPTLSNKKHKIQNQKLDLQSNLRLFEDPVRVLQRAIESPDDYSICQSMENLLSVGALKLKKVLYADTNKEKIKVRVTKLGKFYNEIPCDIKLAKFICFGYFFDCLVECISIASIYSQRKSFFIPFQRISNDINKIDQFTDMIFKYDSGQESDMILELKLFKDWENQFFQPFLQRYQAKRNMRKGGGIEIQSISQSQMTELSAYINPSNDQLTLAQKLDLMKKQVQPGKSMYNQGSIDPFSNNNKPTLSFSEQIHENDNDGQQFEGALDRGTINSFKMERIQRQEYQWCEEHFCDPKVLREILSTREDFKLRIPKEAGNVRDIFKFQDLNDESHIMKIKFCLAGAFNKYTLKSDIFDIKEMQKIRQYLLVEQMDPFCTIIIENTNYGYQCLSVLEKDQVINKIKQGVDQFCIQRVRQVISEENAAQMQNKEFVNKIKLKYSSVYIEFSKSNFLTILLKEIMTLKRRYFNHTKLLDKDTNIKEIPATQLLNYKSIDFDRFFIKGQNTFKYAYEAKLNLSNSKLNRLVSLESDSINLVTLGDYNRHKYLVASELMCRGHRVVAQGITVMPSNQPLFLAYAALIFGSQCYVNCDKDGKKYETVNVDNVEIEIDHYLLEKDIKEVNDIRRELRACLDEDSFFNGQANLIMDLWNKVKTKLLSRIALRHVDSEKWEDFYSRDYLSGRFQANVELENKLKVLKILNSIRTSQNNQDLNKEIEASTTGIIQKSSKPKRNVKLLFQNHKRKTNQDKTTHASEKGFMNQILQTKQTESNLVTLSEQDNIDLLQEYFENYNLWKQKKIRELKHFFLLHSIQEPYIACKSCYQEMWFQIPLFKAGKFSNMLEKVKQISFNGFTDNLYLKDMQFDNGKIVYTVQKQNSNDQKDLSFTQNQEFIDELDKLLNPLKYFSSNGYQNQVQIETLKFYACQNGHLIGFTNEDNQLYNNMKIPDCKQLLLLYPDLDYIQFTENTFSEFQNNLSCEEMMEKQEKKAEMLLQLQKMDCVICCCMMTDNDKIDEEIKLQDQGVDLTDWRSKLEKHLKTEQHKLNEELFLKSTRSSNYFFSS